MKKCDSEIAYQNKDIVSKILAEKFLGKSLRVYGLDLPEIIETLPTNLPAIEANELRIDNLFRLADDSVVILDYESTYKESNKFKYLKYVERVGERYQQDVLHGMKIWMIVIYTADIEYGTTKDHFDFGSSTITIKEAFLSKLDSLRIKKKLTEKILNGIELTEDEMMEFIILPLTYSGYEAKNDAIRDAFSLVKRVKNEETATFILSGILVFTDKVINKSLTREMKEWLKMTQVGRLFEEEKMEAVKEGKKEGIKEGIKDSVREMLKNGIELEKVVQCIKQLTREEIIELQGELNNNKKM